MNKSYNISKRNRVLFSVLRRSSTLALGLEIWWGSSNPTRYVNVTFSVLCWEMTAVFARQRKPKS